MFNGYSFSFTRWKEAYSLVKILYSRVYIGHSREQKIKRLNNGLSERLINELIKNWRAVIYVQDVDINKDFAA